VGLYQHAEGDWLVLPGMRLRGMPATLWSSGAVKDDYREAMARALGVLASTTELLTPPQPTVDDEGVVH
jgi:hypothetical protein